MILGEQGSLCEVEANYGVTLNSFTENESFALSPGEIDASTPRKGGSVSYLELTSSYNEGSALSDTSLQRMRCLSQSINDLKILREKQQERKHEMGDLLNDDFLHEHARKLKDARTRIRELEVKYQSQQRTRAKFDATSLDKQRRNSGLDDRNETSPACSGNTGEENTDGYSGSTQVQDGITQPEEIVTARRPRKPRPLTWANEEDFSFDCSSLSSFGSSRKGNMEIIPEKLDRNHCCYGYEGEAEKLDCDGTEFRLRHEGNTAHHLTPRKHSRHNETTSTNTTKWRSMPNLPTNENTFPENQALMYGEAIPVDPTQDSKKHNTKFGRKSGFYKVNESPDKNSTHSTKKRKFREKLFRRSKKNSRKLVSSPTEGLVLGRVVRCHPSIDTAYIIELNRPEKGTFGFHIHKGCEKDNHGIFVCKIVDKKSEKFLSGLLHVGDEILEINDTNVKEQSLTFVQKLIKNTDKLLLTILPCSSRQEQ